MRRKHFRTALRAPYVMHQIPVSTALDTKAMEKEKFVRRGVVPTSRVRDKPRQAQTEIWRRSSCLAVQLQTRTTLKRRFCWVLLGPAGSGPFVSCSNVSSCPLDCFRGLVLGEACLDSGASVSASLHESAWLEHGCRETREPHCMTFYPKRKRWVACGVVVPSHARRLIMRAHPMFLRLRSGVLGRFVRPSSCVIGSSEAGKQATENY